MSDYFVYAVGAALVDTEIEVTDAELEQLGIVKGMMTLVDEARQTEIKEFLADRLTTATHACGGSAGNSVIAASQFGASTYMSCLVSNDSDGDIYVRDLEGCGVSHGFADGRRDARQENARIDYTRCGTQHEYLPRYFGAIVHHRS